MARWNGQTRGAEIFSVAQHSPAGRGDLRARSTPAAPRDAQLAALLHDAPEYVIGDMISPFKAAIGGEYKAVERRLLAAIHIRFGLAARDGARARQAIKAADRDAAYFRGDDSPASRLGGAQILRRAAGCAETALRRISSPGGPRTRRRAFSRRSRARRRLKPRGRRRDCTSVRSP